MSPPRVSPTDAWRIGLLPVGPGGNGQAHVTIVPALSLFSRCSVTSAVAIRAYVSLRNSKHSGHWPTIEEIDVVVECMADIVNVHWLVINSQNVTEGLYRERSII